MIRVHMVSHDLSNCQVFLRALHSQPGFSIIGQSQNLMELYSNVEGEVPDLVIISHELTQFDEFEMVLALFAALKVKWIPCTDSRQTKAIGDRGSTLQRSNTIMLDMADSVGANIVVLRSMQNQNPQYESAPKDTNKFEPSGVNSIVLIGASTGGIDALTSLLSTFPLQCPPTIIVQHTGEHFGAGLVQLIDRICPAQVAMVEDSEPIKVGMIRIAAGVRKHVTLTGRQTIRTQYENGPAISGHLPSIDALFHSAVPYAKSVIAVILTGMGRDGADGLLALRQAGARTYSQDEQSSVVYGMPKVAWEIGAAQARVPLNKLTEKILKN